MKTETHNQSAEPRCPVCGKGMHRNIICGESVWKCNMSNCRYTMPRDNTTVSQQPVIVVRGGDIFGGGDVCVEEGCCTTRPKLPPSPGPPRVPMPYVCKEHAHKWWRDSMGDLHRLRDSGESSENVALSGRDRERHSDTNQKQ